MKFISKLKVISIYELDNNFFVYNLLNLRTFIKQNLNFLICCPLVGGGVRRCYKTRKISLSEFKNWDLDFVCSNIDKIKTILSNKKRNFKFFYNIKSLHFDNLQVHQLRSEKFSLEKSKLFFDKANLYDDYLRRDFTFNSMFFFWKTKELIYFDNSLEDLKQNIIKPIQFDTFKLDCSRILRYFSLKNEGFSQNEQIEEWIQSKKCFNLVSKQYKQSLYYKRCTYEKRRSVCIFNEKNMKKYKILKLFIEK